MISTLTAAPRLTDITTRHNTTLQMIILKEIYSEETSLVSSLRPRRMRLKMYHFTITSRHQNSK